MVERTGKIVEISYHGRNESPNTEGKGALGKIRDAAVALGAMVGISEMQWATLLKGIIAE